MEAEIQYGMIHKKHKKHKHKKHRKRKDAAEGDEACEGMAEKHKPSLKLKIKIGGQTLGEKNVVKSEIPDASSDDSLTVEVTKGEVDEEVAFLEKMKDPSLMTARQRALMESKTQKDKEDPVVPPAPLLPEKEMTEEMIQRRMLRAKRRKEQADEKREKDKKETIERLLKKTDAKMTRNKKLHKRADLPKMTYVVTQQSVKLHLPSGFEYPLKPATSPIVPTPVLCGIEGCKNLKKYSCSKTGVPLCSLQCYKINMKSL